MKAALSYLGTAIYIITLSALFAVVVLASTIAAVELLAMIR